MIIVILCDSIFESYNQLLYQGLARIWSKLALIVYSESNLAHILPLLKSS